MTRLRKRFVLATMKDRHDEESASEYFGLWNLRETIHPNISSVWQRTANFYLTRKVAESV